MHFTLWPSRTANEGGHAEIAWSDFLGFISEPASAESKDTLEGWSPARFTGNHRAKSAVELVSAVVLDDDASGLPLERVCEIWSPFAGVVHTSFSHTNLNPKFRIVLRVSRDMSADEHARMWAHAHAHAAKHGQRLDEVTRDPSRLWFVPARRADAPYAWRELAGAPLDVDVVLKEVVPNVVLPVPVLRADALDAGQRPAAHVDRRAAIATALGVAWPAKGRHEAQLALAGALRGEGFTEPEAVEFLCHVCRTAGDENRTKREATVRRTWSQPEGSALTGWTRLKQSVDPVIVDAARSVLGRDAGWIESTNRRLVEAASQTSPSPSPEVVGDTLAAGPFVFKVGGLDAPQPPIVYAVDGLICKADVCMLVAHGGSLKTWLAFSLAVSISSGRPWLGRFVVLRGRAAILDFESGSFEVTRRLKMLGAKDGDVEGRLLRCSYSGANLLEPETWITLATLGLELLVIDSFSAASPDTDENDARSAIMLQHAGRFAEATGCTVVFIHHARKGSGGDRRESVRGSTAIFAACDRIFEFSEPEKKPGGVIVSTMHSVKDGAGRSPAKVTVELSDNGLRFVESAPEVESSPAQDVREQILSVLRKHPMGLAKQALLDLLPVQTAVKKSILASLEVSSQTVEFRQDRKVVVMLNPNVAR